MACLGVIDCDSNIEDSPFIIAEEGTITSAAEEIESLGTQVGDAITQIESEITGGGLDEYSLYVNGSSPAYDEAMKIIEDLNLIKEDLSKLAESYEQNYLEHYSKELDKFIEKVKEKIEELKGQLSAKEEELAAKEEAYKSTKNDPDRASYKADIDAVKAEIEELKEEIKKYEKKLEEAEEKKSGIDAEVEKIVAAKVAEEQAKAEDTTPSTTEDDNTTGSRNTSSNSGYVPSTGGNSGGISGGTQNPSEKPDENTDEDKIKIDYDLNKDKVEFIESKAYIKSSKEEQSEIDKYIEELKKKGKFPKDFTGYFYDKANNRILYLTKGKLEKVNKPALIDGKFFYFKDGIAHIIDHNYTAKNMNIPYYNLEKGLLVDGKTYTKEELAKIFKEAPSLATSAAGISFIIGKNVNPTELTTIQGWDYKANEGLNGLKLAEQYNVNAFTTNNSEYVVSAVKAGYPVSIAKEDGFVTVVGVDEKGNYQVLDPKNEKSFTTTVKEADLFKDVKADSKDRYTIYGAKSPEEYDKTKTNVTDIRKTTINNTKPIDEKQNKPNQENQNNNNQDQSNNDQNNNTNNENTANNNNNNENNTNNGQDATNNTNNQSNNTNNENTANQNNNDNAQNNQNADNANNDANTQNAANDATNNQNTNNQNTANAQKV